MSPDTKKKKKKKRKTRRVKTAPPKQPVPSFHRSHLPNEEDVVRFHMVSKPHVESFDYFLSVGLSRGINDLVPAEIDIVDPSMDGEPDLAEVSTVSFWVANVKVHKPIKAKSTKGGFASKLFPRECREARLMYAGEITGDFCYQVVARRNGAKIPGRVQRMRQSFGKMPIMVRSQDCHLRGLTPAQLASIKEEQTEFGGYFIVSGIERCVRLLQVPRRNHPMAIQRSNFKNRGSSYTEMGIAMRCSRACGDQSTITNTLHYLSTGGATLRFVARKQEFLIPVILVLRALSGNMQNETSAADADSGAGVGRSGITDSDLYKRIVRGDNKNTFLQARTELLLQEARAKFPNLNTPQECLEYVGERFRNLSQRADTTSDLDVGHYVINRYIFIHLVRYKDKLECLLFMLRKLYAFVAGDCGVDNADSLQNQEILLPGHLLSTFVKEKFDEMVQATRLSIIRDLKNDFPKVSNNFQNASFWTKRVARHFGLSSGGVGKKVQHFLSTGNIISSTGLDLMQVSGYTIVAERLNFLRFCSHFRSVHRGQFFMEMRTTAVRKLLPDQWGFLCPVHTPDGGPCGLLSHLALKCSVLAFPQGDSLENIEDLLVRLGVAPAGAGGSKNDGRPPPTHTHLPVCVDGKFVGGASAKLCRNIAVHLRQLKVQDPPRVPPTLEVALIPAANNGGPYPGLFLFTEAARVIRPVLHRGTGCTEFIGPMEQPFMDIACLDEDIREGITTHQELDPTNMLSLIASLTPFSDYNQSPRNMYQCQMGKQTMGTPVHSFPYRSDNKLYRLQNPQAPLVQTKRHSEFKMDEYPNGTNAVVAVLSYTGFDMEDAMILNQGSFGRGFGHASMYKTMPVSLEQEAKMAGSSSESGDVPRLRFGNSVVTNEKGKRELKYNLGADGLPKVGQVVCYDEPLFCLVDEVEEREKVVRHKEKEPVRISCVRALGDASGNASRNSASITMVSDRNPVIGDKFSSRHGQKGVLSILWPQEDMPFSESGLTPDVIINPHAFPSRMTIGMLIESMAAKAGALHGNFQDATPFTFHETGDQIAIDYFGEQLQAAGYNYYGSEPLYSGVSGRLMHADLYIGVVYYQRLRHMVSDKYQVRATGPVNPLTRQPIKGRKNGGGIRLGEMERDSLLSHGAAFLLNDRLLNCSDKSVTYACSRCGDLLSPTTERCAVVSTGPGSVEPKRKQRLRLICRNPKCIDLVKREGASDPAVEPIVLPYVYRYLANELAAMNIRMKMELE